jgi:hypothetical protein
MNLKM